LGSTRVDLGFASWCFDGKKKSWQTCDAGMFIRSSEKLSSDFFGVFGAAQELRLASLGKGLSRKTYSTPRGRQLVSL
jgi:hypothetical protein